MLIEEVSVYEEQQQGHRHYTEISGPEATIISSFIGALFIAVGWIVVHRTALKREREAREHADRREKEAARLELLSSLQHWLQTFVVETDPVKLKHLYYFGGGIKGLAAASEKFRGYASDKAAFDRLNYHVSNMNPETLDAKGSDARRDTICNAIRDFIEFVRIA